jgi:hypothetical protein
MASKQWLCAALVPLLGWTAQAKVQDEPKPTHQQTTPPQVSKEGLKENVPFCHRASKVVGTDVKNLKKEDLGEVKELVIDPESGEIAYAVISFGGLFGIGDKLFAVPWHSLMMDREHKAVLLAVNKETLERAPSFNKDKWPDRYDQTWSDNVNKAWSDAGITAAVKSKLVADKASSLVKVNVETNQGVVELKGTVDSERTKQRATDLARQVEGVRKVVNNLKTG